jgi:hypothetical protein
MGAVQKPIAQHGTTCLHTEGWESRHTCRLCTTLLVGCLLVQVATDRITESFELRPCPQAANRLVLNGLELQKLGVVCFRFCRAPEVTVAAAASLSTSRYNGTKRE